MRTDNGKCKQKILKSIDCGLLSATSLALRQRSLLGDVKGGHSGMRLEFYLIFKYSSIKNLAVAIFPADNQTKILSFPKSTSKFLHSLKMFNSCLISEMR